MRITIQTKAENTPVGGDQALSNIAFMKLLAASVGGLLVLVAAALTLRILA